MTSISVNGGDVMPAFSKLTYALKKEGTFVILKCRRFHMKASEKVEYKKKRRFNARVRQKYVSNRQVDNNA